MGIDACFDREMDMLDGQLADGEITQREYDKAVRDLERDMSLDMSDHGEWKP